MSTSKNLGFCKICSGVLRLEPPFIQGMKLVQSSQCVDCDTPSKFLTLAECSHASSECVGECSFVEIYPSFSWDGAEMYEKDPIWVCQRHAEDIESWGTL